MGRRLNTSQPTVIQTTLTPLSDIFQIEADDALEQWYYVNTGAFSPDRTLTPLKLTPKVAATDPDTAAAYTPALANAAWYYLDPSDTADRSSDSLWPGTGWVRITAIEGGDGVDYYCPAGTSFSLYVRKNVAPPSTGAATAGVTLCCVAQYIDPRDSGVTYTVKETVLLATSQDSTMQKLEIQLSAPAKTVFNVFTKEGDTLDFKATLLGDGNADVTSDYYVEWYGKTDNGTEEKLMNTLACYTEAAQRSGKGQGTDTITLNAMYAENLDIVCRVRKSAGGALLPAVAQCALVWEYPKIKAVTYCENGSVVDAGSRDMTFGNFVQLRGGELTEAQMDEHLRFNWKRRVSSSASYTDMGWGRKVTKPSGDFRQTTTYSTPVHAEVYMLGAYEEVTQDGEAVTQDGGTVYGRSMY